jgi:hypothetical protein
MTLRRHAIWPRCSAPGAVSRLMETGSVIAELDRQSILLKRFFFLMDARVRPAHDDYI